MASKVEANMVKRSILGLIATLIWTTTAIAQPQLVGPLDARNNLSEIAGNGSAAQATARSNLGLGSIATQGANSIAITGGVINGLSSVATSGPIKLTGSGTSGAYDAQINVLGGGTISGQGLLQEMSGDQLFTAPDATAQLELTMQLSATDHMCIQGGVLNVGPAIYACSATETNVPLNISSWGATAPIYFYNGAGYLFNMQPSTGPGPTANYPVTTSSISGSPVIYGAGGTDGTINLSIQAYGGCGAVAMGSNGTAVSTATACGAIALGRSASASGIDSFAFGSLAAADQSDAVSIGPNSWNKNRYGGTCFASGSITGQRGTNQACWYVLRSVMTGAGSKQLTTDGQIGAGYNSMRLGGGNTPSGAIWLDCKVTVSRTDTYQSALWTIENVGIKAKSGAISLVTGSPTTFTAGPSDSGISGVTVSFTLDSVNLSPAITVTTTATGITYDITARCAMLDNI